MKRVEHSRKLLKKAKLKFAIFSLLGITVIFIISVLAYNYHQKVVQQQVVIQNLHQGLSRQLALIHEVAKMGENLDSAKHKDLGKVTSEINVLVESLNKNNQKLIHLFQSDSVIRFGKELKTDELAKKMGIYIDKAKELSDNKLTNFHEIKRNIRYLSSNAQKELLDLLGRINKEVSLQNKKSIRDLNRVGIWFLALCFIEVILVWSMVFKPLYRTISEQSENLMDAVYEAQSASRSKTNFLANISHEIRTPMTAILGYSQILEEKKGISETEIKNAVSIINKNAAHMLGLIDEILDVSKIEAGKIEMVEEVIDFSNFLHEIYSLMHLKAKVKNISLIFETKGELPVYIRSDQKRLKQIIFNMLGNAIKFTEKGYVKMEISYFKDEKRLHLDVIDTGLGIPEDKKEKIFTLFEQADTSVSRRFGGTGLGLALSRGLAQRMGGNIKLVDSSEGKGSQFEIDLIVGEVSSQKAKKHFSASIKDREDILKEAAASLEKLKILVVDDAKENARLFKIYLSNAGADVDIANNGEEALHKVDGKNYDIILLDLQMPGKDGYQVLKELREKLYFNPVVALTAHAMEDERRKTKKAGFDGHIVKPIQSHDLIEKVSYYCSLV